MPIYFKNGKALPVRPNVQSDIEKKEHSEIYSDLFEYVGCATNNEMISELKQICTIILAKYPEEEYHYLGIGLSPCLVIAALKCLSKSVESAETMPLSYFTRRQSATTKEEYEILKIHFSGYKIKHHGKKTLVIDYVHYGRSLSTAMTDIKKIHPDLRVEGCAFCISHKAIAHKYEFGKMKVGYFSSDNNEAMLPNMMRIKYLENFRPNPSFQIKKGAVLNDTSPQSLSWLCLKSVIKNKLSDSSIQPAEVYHFNHSDDFET